MSDPSRHNIDLPLIGGAVSISERVAAIFANRLVALHESISKASGDMEAISPRFAHEVLVANVAVIDTPEWTTASHEVRETLLLAVLGQVDAMLMGPIRAKLP